MNQESRLRAVQQQIRYFLEDERKIWEALQAPGATFNHTMDGLFIPEGNKRLALVGDSILRTVLVEAAYAKSEYRGQVPH